MKFEGDMDIICPNPKCRTEFVDHTNEIDKGDGARTVVKCHACGIKYIVEPTVVFNTAIALKDSEIEVDLGKAVEQDRYKRAAALHN